MEQNGMSSVNVPNAASDEGHLKPSMSGSTNVP